jgi:DNA-binding transcriptional ArsR family regulator
MPGLRVVRDSRSVARRTPVNPIAVCGVGPHGRPWGFRSTRPDESGPPTQPPNKHLEVAPSWHYGDTMTQPPDLDGLRVVAHPLRLRLLSLLTAESLSAAEAARVLGESQSNVSYHLRRLAQAGLVDLVEETRVRGGTAKRYRHDPASGEALLSGTGDEHRALMAALAAELVRRAARYEAGTPIVFTDAEVSLLPDAWARVSALAREAGRIIHDEAVPQGTPQSGRVGATLALFSVRSPETGSGNR